MNTKELKQIIKAVEKGEGVKIANIAAKAKVNRSYLSTLINGEEVKAVEESFLGKIAKAYPEYFDNQQKPTDDVALDKVLASLNEIREYTISILTGQSAGHEVMMGALDRLEENPEGSLASAADRLALQLAKRFHAIRKGK